ncbi:hypothetical protein [Tabrizicola sp. M-4]|uniref:hypothetical protein n=1 Tax=Tabrizicola sp. M-4 TaxID=3055847 RepID=UPI003DA94667
MKIEIYRTMGAYGMIDLGQISRLVRATDIALYFRMACVRRMRKPEFYVGRQEIYEWLGASLDAHIGSLLQTIDRSAQRASHVLGCGLSVERVRNPGQRSVSGLSFRIKPKP